jgi:hypothetical protein
MANVTIDFEKLKSNHLSYTDIRSKLTDIPPYIDETCAVQLSYALNRSDGVIGKYDYPDRSVATGKVRAYKSSDGFFYIFAVPDIRVYLNNAYGDAENFKGSKPEESKAMTLDAITDRKGVLAFGHRHIDLWVGNNIHRPSDYFMDVLWNNDSTRLRGIFFWEVTLPASP